MSPQQPTLLVTIATQRSGTKFFGTALSAGSVARSLGEIFQPGSKQSDFGGFMGRFVAERGSFDFQGATVLAAINAYVDQLAASIAPRLLHFDLMYNNLAGLAPIWSSPAAPPDQGFLFAWLRQRRATIVHIIRPDLAETYASHAIAEARGVYHTGSEDGVARDMSLTLAPAEAYRYALPIIRTRRYVRRAFAGYRTYVELSYPDFVSDTTVAPAAGARVASLLGVSADALFGESPLRPTAPSKKDLVTNLEAISALLAEVERVENRAG